MNGIWKLGSIACGASNAVEVFNFKMARVDSKRLGAFVRYRDVHKNELVTCLRLGAVVREYEVAL
jgi:hypothetical protein